MGFIGMAPAVAKYIATKSIDEAAALASLEDIPDLEYRDYAKKVMSDDSYTNVHMHSSNLRNFDPLKKMCEIS